MRSINLNGEDVTVYGEFTGNGSLRQLVLESKTLVIWLQPSGLNLNCVNRLDVGLHPPKIVKVRGVRKQEPTEFKFTRALVDFSDGSQLHAKYKLERHTVKEHQAVFEGRLIEAAANQRANHGQLHQPKTDSVGTGTSSAIDPGESYCHGYREAAAYVSCSEKTVKNWKHRGWVEFEQTVKGGRIRFQKSELDKCRKTSKREP